MADYMNCTIASAERVFLSSPRAGEGKMGRRRSRRRWRSYGSYVVSKRQSLSSTFGGIDRDVERMFLALHSDDLEELLEVYADEFGASAGNYARKTYPKWKSGQVRMSGEVAERLLNLLPPLLPYDARFDLVKKLRQANFRKLIRHVHTSPEKWVEDLLPVIEEVVRHGDTANLSEGLKQRLAWLADGDIAVAEKMMSAAIKDESIMRLSYLKAEFQRIEGMIVQLDNYHASIQHTIELPQGTIHVRIVVPKVSMWTKLKNWLG